MIWPDLAQLIGAVLLMLCVLLPVVNALSAAKPDSRERIALTIPILGRFNLFWRGALLFKLR